jgi:hypothetical protein
MTQSIVGKVWGSDRLQPEFATVDIFIDHRFGSNPPALVTDGRG